MTILSSFLNFFYSRRMAPPAITYQLLMIELTNACNFSCIMCPNKLKTRKKGFMDFELFRLVLDRCEEEKISNLPLFTTGEPLLHPRFLEMLCLAASRPAIKEIVINTNGSQLNETYIKEIIKEKKCRLYFSFSGWDKESYENRYVGGKFSETVKNLSLINQIYCETNPHLIKFATYGIIDSKEAMQKTAYFLKNSVGLQDSQIGFDYSFDWIGSISGKHSDGRANGQNDKKKGRRISCDFNNRLGVLYDGRVTACGCRDVDGNLIIGDLKKQSFREIKKGAALKKIIRKFNQGDLRGLICYKCTNKRIYDK